MNVTIQVPDERIASALKKGYESGIRYWADNIDVQFGKSALDPCHVSESMRRFYWPLFDGMWVVRDSVSRSTFQLTRESVTRGLAVLIYSHAPELAELLSRRPLTADIGDTLVQCSLFGRLIYAKKLERGRTFAVHRCSDCHGVPPCACPARGTDTIRPTVRPT